MEPSKRGNSNRSGAYSVLVSHRVVAAAAAAAVAFFPETNAGLNPHLMNINATTLCSAGRPTD